MFDTFITICILIVIAIVSEKLSEKMDSGSMIRFILRKVIPISCNVAMAVSIIFNFIRIFTGK